MLCGSQKKSLNETLLLSNQNACLNVWVIEYLKSSLSALLSKSNLNFVCLMIVHTLKIYS